MNRLCVPAPAKLNLFLHVTGRRADGYHLLESLFVAIDFGDTITLTRRDDGTIRRATELAGVPPESDLAVRAAAALKKTSRRSFGVDIALTKRVPMGVAWAEAARMRRACSSRSIDCGKRRCRATT
jgi:4-diphosphocytidyl-2-C-methyl-D-erythritol kinase